MLAPYFIAACFSFGNAAAKDIQTILLTRFFAGLFGSAPVTNTGGVLGDIWSPQQRGTAIVGYAFAVVGGPTIGVWGRLGILKCLGDGDINAAEAGTSVER